MWFLPALASITVLSGIQHAAASTILFQADPSVIYPVLSKSLKVRCAVEKEVRISVARDMNTGNVTVGQLLTDWVTPSWMVLNRTTPLPAISHADVFHIMSIFISRYDRVTGKLVTVARISAYDPASASVDLDNIKVTGDTAASPIWREQGFLEVSWEYPTEAQSGQYSCDIYALDSTLHPVSLSWTLGITSTAVSLQDLAAFVAQNQRYVTALESSLTNLTAQLSELQADSQARIEALNSTIDSLQDQMEHAKAQNIQTGTFSCTDTYVDTLVTFPQPYHRIPTVFVPTFNMSSSSGNWNFTLTINNLTTTGFTSVCYQHSFISNDIKWIAIDN